MIYFRDTHELPYLRKRSPRRGALLPFLRQRCGSRFHAHAGDGSHSAHARFARRFAA